jgi:hypothetical protein
MAEQAQQTRPLEKALQLGDHPLVAGAERLILIQPDERLMQHPGPESRDQTDISHHPSDLAMGHEVEGAPDGLIAEPRQQLRRETRKARRQKNAKMRFVGHCIVRTHVDHDAVLGQHAFHGRNGPAQVRNVLEDVHGEDDVETTVQFGIEPGDLDVQDRQVLGAQHLAHGSAKAGIVVEAVGAWLQRGDVATCLLQNNTQKTKPRADFQHALAAKFDALQRREADADFSDVVCKKAVDPLGWHTGPFGEGHELGRCQAACEVGDRYGGGDAPPAV